LLTNAHVVADATFVTVRRHGSSTKYTAKVEAIGHECDVAMLTVEDPIFWRAMRPLSFGGIPVRAGVLGTANQNSHSFSTCL